MKPVAWRYENKNVKGNWYITWTEPPDGFNKRPLYEHPPQDAANSCLYEDTKKLEQQLAASEQDRQDQIDLTIARAEEVKQLRQQLADMTAERDEFMEYAKDGTVVAAQLQTKLTKAQTQSARRLEGLCKCGVEKDQLHEQVTLLRDALEEVTALAMNLLSDAEKQVVEEYTEAPKVFKICDEALATTDDLSGYILCEKEPVVWMQSDHLSKFIHHACGSQASLVRCSDHQLMPDFQPLYRAKEPKP